MKKLSTYVKEKLNECYESDIDKLTETLTSAFSIKHCNRKNLQEFLAKLDDADISYSLDGPKNKLYFDETEMSRSLMKDFEKLKAEEIDENLNEAKSSKLSSVTADSNSSFEDVIEYLDDNDVDYEIDDMTITFSTKQLNASELSKIAKLAGSEVVNENLSSQQLKSASHIVIAPYALANSKDENLVGIFEHRHIAAKYGCLSAYSSSVFDK